MRAPQGDLPVVQLLQAPCATPAPEAAHLPPKFRAPCPHTPAIRARARLMPGLLCSIQPAARVVLFLCIGTMRDHDLAASGSAQGLDGCALTANPQARQLPQFEHAAALQEKGFVRAGLRLR